MLQHRAALLVVEPHQADVDALHRVEQLVGHLLDDVDAGVDADRYPVVVPPVYVVCVIQGVRSPGAGTGPRHFGGLVRGPHLVQVAILRKHLVGVALAMNATVAAALDLAVFCPGTNALPTYVSAMVLSRAVGVDAGAGKSNLGRFAFQRTAVEIVVAIAGWRITGALAPENDIGGTARVVDLVRVIRQFGDDVAAHTSRRVEDEEDIGLRAVDRVDFAEKQFGVVSRHRAGAKQRYGQRGDKIQYGSPFHGTDLPLASLKSLHGNPGGDAGRPARVWRAVLPAKPTVW